MAAPLTPGTVMTIRVYKIHDGEITEDTGVKLVQPVKSIDEVDSKYPPCSCPGHRPIGRGLM